MSFVLQAPVPMYGLLFPDNLKKNPHHFVDFVGTKLVMVYYKHNVSIATTMRNLARLIDAPIHTVFADFVVMQRTVYHTDQFNGMYQIYQSSITLDMDDSKKDELVLQAIGRMEFQKKATRSTICLINDIALKDMHKFAFFGLGVFRSVMSVRRGEAEALAADAMKELGGAAAAGKRATEQNEETPKRASKQRKLYVP